jgi:hypothetical protein
MSKVKTEVSTAVAIAAGILLGSGYTLTLARLLSKGLPTESVLAALPASFYVGTAVQSAWLPLAITLTAGAVWLVGVSKSSQSEMPKPGSWMIGIISVSIYAWLASQVLYREGIRHASVDFFLTSAVGLVVMIALALIVRAMASLLLSSHTEPTLAARNGLVASAILILSVLAAVGFRTLTVLYLPNALVRAIVLEDPAACPVGRHQTEPPKLGCGENGYYLGESDNWVYLVLQPSEDSCPHREAPIAGRPNELVQIAKSKIHRVILYKESQPQPPLVCPDPEAPPLPPPLPKPPTAIQAKDAAVPDAKGPVKEQVWAPEVPTLAEPFKLAGAGHSIPHNRYVWVSCKLYWPYPESVEKDGYWYRIITKPWHDKFAAANSFWNGDKPGTPLTHATDFHVRDCRKSELPYGD